MTCPWRVYEHPVVQAALKLRKSAEKGLINLDEQLAVVVEAYQMIDTLQTHIELIDAKAEREAEEAARRVKDASRNRP